MYICIWIHIPQFSVLSLYDVTYVYIVRVGRLELTVQWILQIIAELLQIGRSWRARLSWDFLWDCLLAILETYIAFCFFLEFLTIYLDFVIKIKSWFLSFILSGARLHFRSFHGKCMLTGHTSHYTVTSFAVFNTCLFPQGKFHSLCQNFFNIYHNTWLVNVYWNRAFSS